MLKEFILIVLFLSVFSAFTLAKDMNKKDVNLEFEGRYWISDLQAKARIVSSGIGTVFDLKSDLDIGDEDFPEARLTWQTTANSRLRFAFTKVNYSGSKDIDRVIEFKGTSFNTGTRLNSGFDIEYLRFGWIWQFINIAGDKLKIGSIIEAKGILADISLEAPNLSPVVKRSQELFGGLPTLGAAIDVSPMKKVNLFGEISGLNAGDFGYFLDAETGIKLIPFKNLRIIAGFRVIDIKAKDDPDFAKIKITGPFVAATLRL